jgi:hypothetical protein
MHVSVGRRANLHLKSLEGRGYEVSGGRRGGDRSELRCPVRLVSVHHRPMSRFCGKLGMTFAYFQEPLEAREYWHSRDCILFG